MSQWRRCRACQCALGVTIEPFLWHAPVALLDARVFLDSDDLHDLRVLMDHVRDSDVLVILQSAEVMQRPW